jgi:hypothetical protein
MNQPFTVKSCLAKIDIRIYAVLFSIIISLLALCNRDPLNMDGIFYLTIAAAYNKAGLAAAMSLYGWPFYAVFIGLFSQLSHLSLLYSAYCINTFCATLIVIAYLTLLKELSAARSVQIIGALLILVYPTLNDYRVNIIRDLGFWAFALIALLHLLRYAKTSYWRHALGWNIAMLVASLFRIEGVLLLAFTPLGLLFLADIPLRQRIQALVKIYSLPFIAALFLLVKQMLHPASHNLGRVNELVDQFQHGWLLVSNNIDSKITLLSQTVLAPFSSSHAPLFFTAGAAALFLERVVSAMTPLYLLFCLHAWKNKLAAITRQSKTILLSFTLVNLIILVIFFSEQLFLAGRYLLIFCLPLLLWAPFSLQSIFADWRQKKSGYAGKPWLFPALIIALAIMLLSGIQRFGYSKAYITDAGLWLKNNTPTSASVYSNRQEVLFYAERTPVRFGQPGNNLSPQQIITSKVWRHFDYLALAVAHDEQSAPAAIIALMGKEPLHIFSNKRKDTIFIFKLRKDNATNRA